MLIAEKFIEFLKLKVIITAIIKNYLNFKQ